MAVYLDARKTSNRAALFNKRIVFRCGNYGRSVVSIVHKRATLRVRNTEQERARERERREREHGGVRKDRRGGSVAGVR